MRRNAAALLLASATVAVGLVWLARPAEGATAPDPETRIVCGGVFGLRDYPGWRNGWGNHDSNCIAGQVCRNGVLTITLAFTPSRTGFISADTDEHLLAQGIHAGVSLGPRTARVSFYRQVLRGGELVSQKVSCSARVFRGRLTNLWLVWIVRP
jgi:hypothetical protein